MSGEKKILIIQTAFPGDAILTLPFIQELKKQKPDYNIDVLCIPSTKEIFEASSAVNSVIQFDKRGKHNSLFAFIKFIRDLRSRNYKIIYSPHRSLRSALIAVGFSAQETYGFDNSALKYAFKKTVHYDPKVHEVRRNLEFLESDFSDDKWRIFPEIKISSETMKKVTDFINEKKLEKFITIAPGSVWETKKYPIEYFKNIVDYFKQKNYQIVLIGGSQDEILCSEITKDIKENIYITAGRFSFIETIELLKHTELLICNDSAPTHLGMCAGIPVLTIYCSTVPEFGFYPYNQKSDYISFNDLFCKPCGIHGFSSCPLNHFNCAKLLHPGGIIEKAERILSNVS
jgi:heptosyltransferase-2